MFTKKTIDTKAIAKVLAMQGPAEGQLLVWARPPGKESSWLYEPAEAIQAIRATPGPWEVEEKWKLPA
jgi:hypothetical protein